jgi:TonB family protein
MRLKAGVTFILVFASALPSLSGSSPRSLGKIELISLLVSYVGEVRLWKFVQQRGINFQVTDGDAAMLKRAGASESLLKAIATARVVELSAPGPATEQVILEHLVRGEELRAKDNDAAAEQEFQSAVSSDPNNPFTHYVLGAAYQITKTQAAMGEFKEAIRLQPDFLLALVGLASVLEHEGDYDAVVTTLREALRLEPGNSEAHVLLGVAFWKMGDHDSATSEFNIASNIAPSPGIPPRIRLGGQVEAAKLLFHPAPQYPSKAKRKGLQGTVKLGAIILRDGTIKDVKLVEGDPILAKAAIEAFSRWRYEPTMINGEPVEVVTEVDVNFTLEP